MTALLPEERLREFVTMLRVGTNPNYVVRQAVAEAAEACAKVCREQWERGTLRDPGNLSYREGFEDGTGDCAAEIRRRAGE